MSEMKPQIRSILNFLKESMNLSLLPYSKRNACDTDIDFTNHLVHKYSEPRPLAKLVFINPEGVLCIQINT